MKRGLDACFSAWRFYLIVVMIALVVVGLFARLIDLMVFKKDFLRAEGNARVIRIVDNPVLRGMITDRRGVPLAVSTPVYSVWINPQSFQASAATLKSISTLLGIAPKKIQASIESYRIKKREFVYIKRNLPPSVAEQIKSLAIPGVYLQRDFKRFYPQGEMAAQVVGFTNIDDKGQEGLELAYNQWLSGTTGKKIVIKDRRGREISNVKTLREEIPGNNLALSIDNRIQYLAYRELLDGVQKNVAVSGSVVVLDLKTGEVLAMVNQPSFNPNHREGVSRDAFRNRVVTDIFEPGSTIKAFSIASALDSGKYKADTVIDTAPGWIRVGRNIVKDIHNKGSMTVSEVLQYSSNVGTTKMILSLPPNQLWDVLHRVGFGETTGVGFPGERSGVLINRTEWKPFALATLSFGYGMSATTLQLAEAYATLANGGIKIPFSLLKTDTPPQGKRVIDADIANEMMKLLETVVAKGGTGEMANIPGYHVAGKTGTSIMAGPKGYQKHHYISSFVGIAPVTNPRLVIAVVITDPRGKHYYGGTVSGPVFKKIMEGSLRILNIPPDDVASLN